MSDSTLAELCFGEPLDLSDVAQRAPIQWLNWPVIEAFGLRVGVKREDLLHPRLGGNKFYKLYYHLQTALSEGHNHVLSFGGAWSNHLYALAAAGQALGLRTTAVVRGERPAELSAMLHDASNMGMRLHFVSREDYRRKTTGAFLADLRTQLGRFYLVPEGAGDFQGAKGCQVLGHGLAQLREHQPFDAVCCAVGTGGTLAGLAAGLPQVVKVCGFSVLKGPGTLAEEVQRLVEQLSSRRGGARWCLETGYHGGGYARLPAQLALFMQEFEYETGVPLDPVYTAKLMWGIAQKARLGEWAPGTRIVALHSGGLQGRRGFPGLVQAG